MTGLNIMNNEKDNMSKRIIKYCKRKKNYLNFGIIIKKKNGIGINLPLITNEIIKKVFRRRCKNSRHDTWCRINPFKTIVLPKVLYQYVQYKRL